MVYGPAAARKLNTDIQKSPKAVPMAPPAKEGLVPSIGYDSKAQAQSIALTRQPVKPSSVKGPQVTGKTETPVATPPATGGEQKKSQAISVASSVLPNRSATTPIKQSAAAAAQRKLERKV